MRSKEYWARRAEERADKHHEELETYLKRIDSLVNGACGRLKKDAETILNKCVARMGMSREETIKLMQEPVDYESLQRMLKTIEHMPEGAEKRKIQNQVEAKAYGYRVSRIEALEIDIKAESVRLAQRLTEATNNSLKHTAINAIKWTEKDLKEMLGGASISFQKVDPTLIDELIHNSWSGKDFSDRIWKNCEILEKNLNTTLKEGLLSGKGTYRIAEELADDMDCGKYAAQRLVRTETTHVYNEVDRKKYKEAGIEEYEYLACLDERTSDICKRLNGKRFKVDEAKPGVNYPPLHPNCRSTTVAVIERYNDKEVNDRKIDCKIAYKLGKNDSPKMLISKSDALYNNAVKIKGIDGYTDIVIHSDGFNFYNYNMNGDEFKFTPKELAKIINDEKLIKKGEKLRLCACSAAMKGGTAAQNLADYLGIEILAPTEIISVDFEGNMYVTDSDKLTNTGKWITIKPRNK